MYESSGSQFFRNTTGIKSGPDAFDEFWSIMSFLIILRVPEILSSFRLVLEGKVGKVGKEIPVSLRLELSEKFLTNNFALSDEKDNTYGSLKEEEQTDLC